jgi:phosphonatase-like hydrolase
MIPIKLVVFDIAGTIIEDHDEVLSAFRQALAENGVLARECELQEWKGASKQEVIRHFVAEQRRPGNAEADVDHIYHRFREILEAHYKVRVCPIAGADATFGWLLDHDIRIATTTGFYREVRDLILRQAGWEKTFHADICSSDVVLGRPAPYMIFRAMEATGVTDVRQVINVGDTPLDLQAASNAGVPNAIAVLSGSHGVERLAKEKHSHILPSIAELPALMRKEYGAS